MLYNCIKCSHRLTLDLFGDYLKQDRISAFVKMLWEKGIDFEKQVIKDLKVVFLDLSACSDVKKEKRTREAISHGVVKKKTGWPINDYSIKNLASYLGFHWRDKSPSGAEFIE